MPSSVRVRVVAARDLPEMDRTVRGEFCTDAYVDIKFRNYEQVRSRSNRLCLDYKCMRDTCVGRVLIGIESV